MLQQGHRKRNGYHKSQQPHRALDGGRNGVAHTLKYLFHRLFLDFAPRRASFAFSTAKVSLFGQITHILSAKSTKKQLGSTSSHTIMGHIGYITDAPHYSFEYDYAAEGSKCAPRAGITLTITTLCDKVPQCRHESLGEDCPECKHQQ